MQIEWRPEAKADLSNILRYIGERNFAAAVSLSKSIEESTTSLSVHPHLYRKGRSPGTRKIVVHPNYVVIYEVTDRIEILSVLHTRQEYP
ncbi:MAG: type II toxin-antitoxin system RelE/ParE family toxin [Pseudomonas atacamensis]|uniref:type II toxin-antitoxin system RelE/ParE family toxin n=1 Tax=Pseudomonas atacamensis TaxID=2565368 RepID=UPI0033149943